MKCVTTALSDDIDYSAGRLSKLGFVSGCQNLKFRDRFLVKLRCGPAINRIFVRMSVNEEIGVAAAFAQNRRRIITLRVGLPIDRDSGHQLQQVEIISATDGQVLNLLRSDSQAGGRRIRIEQRQVTRDVDNCSYSTSNLQTDIEGYDSIERQLNI